jgi:hypothetical protein
MNSLMASVKTCGSGERLYGCLSYVPLFGFINEYSKQHTSKGLTDIHLFIHLFIYLFMVSLTLPEAQTYLRGIAE